MREKIRQYQGRWMADLSRRMRQSQWKMYLKLGDEFELCALPASMDTVLVY